MKGVAGKLSHTAMESARRHFGEKALILADIQAENTVSHRTAGKWSNQTLPAITVVPAKVRKKKPEATPGVMVGPLGSACMEAFAENLSAFYAGYNLYQPETVESLSAWLSQKPLGFSMRRCLATSDRHGRLLAGLALEDAYQLRTYQVVRMPAVLRMANRILRIIPPDGILREVLVIRFWFRPGGEMAARCLWQQARWECRNGGTSLMAFFDSRSPLARMIPLKPWTIRTAMNPVIRWPTPVSPDRPVCPIP